MANFQQVKYLDRNSPPHITTLVLMAAVASMPLNIFLAALPEMAVHFQKPYAVMQFALTGFLIMTSVLQIFLGPISDRIGRRPVMLASLFLFVLTSIGVANSTDFVMFMTFRLLQGVIVAGFVISRASIRDVSAREKAASMMSYVTMGMALMPMLAPFIGGVLSTHYGWQSSFYLLAILGALTFIVIFFDQGETNSYTNRSIFDQFRAYPALLKSRRFWGYSCTLMFASGTFFAI